LPAAGAAPAASVPDPEAAEDASLMTLFEGLSSEEKTKVQSDADEIFSSKYRMGGERTRHFALLDALRARQGAPASV
jgi:hypothetical protein